MKKKLTQISHLLILLFLLTSCMEAATTRALDNQTNNTTNPSAGNGNGGNTATPGSGGIGNETKEIVAKVELRHLIEPKVDDTSDGGNYKRKLTLPKNYDGMLYLAGVNVSTLANKNVKVRFRFGVNKNPITVQATVSTAPGLTPQTDVEVLVLNLANRPFEDISLIYDLYDYNTYDFANTGSPAGALKVPADHNRNDKLYCRGVELADDPTFTGKVAQGCSKVDDICKFSYAKVVDKGLVRKSTVVGEPNFPLVPKYLASEAGTTGLYNDTDDIKLLRCLPDNPTLSTNFYTYALNKLFSTFGSTHTIGTSDYIFRGPYKTIHYDAWGIKGEALKGEYGVFSGVWDDNSNGLVDTAEVDFGYRSKLYPLYSKFNLGKDNEYLGSNLPHEEKVPTTMVANAESNWMDGCNERATTTHSFTGEHVGSCSVTARIEIITVDDAQNETIVDASDEVKLQLVKPAQLSTNNENVLLSSFQACNSTSQCGSDSCCISNRCWSKSIVSQCVEDLPDYGGKLADQSCQSDHECASLCCNESTGKCGHHDTNSTPPVLCSKGSGQKCVADDWCMKHPVTQCAIVKTGTDAQGGVTCALQCVYVQKHGSCVPQNTAGTAHGVCVPPVQPEQPTFNPADPNRCNAAITYQQLVDEANKNI